MPLPASIDWELFPYNFGGQGSHALPQDPVILGLQDAVVVISRDVLNQHISVGDARDILRAAYEEEFDEWLDPQESSRDNR